LSRSSQRLITANPGVLTLTHSTALHADCHTQQRALKEKRNKLFRSYSNDGDTPPSELVVEEEQEVATDYTIVRGNKGRRVVYKDLTAATAATAAAAADDNALMDVDVDATGAAAAAGEKRAAPEQGLSVEDVALQHYKALGYSGVHSEWRIPQLLTGLLLHDVIWDTSTVPAAFIHRLQRLPLDLWSSDFARRRATAVHQWLSVITSYTREQVEADVAERCDSVQPYYSGVALLCTDMNYCSKDDVVALAAALGGARLAALLQLFMSNIAAYTWGVPDLLLWRSNGEVQFVEVKGTDSLSTGALEVLRQLLCASLLARAVSHTCRYLHAHISMCNWVFMCDLVLLVDQA
jgi:VRR-NUC domain